MPFFSSAGSESGAVDSEVAVGVRPRTSTVSSASSGPVALSSRFRTCPWPVLTARLAAVPSAMPISGADLQVDAVKDDFAAE